VIIGVGAGVLNMHRPALQLPAVDLVGATDVNPQLGSTRAQELGCPFFADVSNMLESTQPDVAVILAPHPFHASLAIQCLEAGIHVLVEKPIAVQVSEADAMITAAKKANRLLAVSFQQRFRPEIQAAKQFLNLGNLGKLQHVDMVVNWFRSRVYFASGKWRATWQGEGGGVLMNQAPHNLDLLCYLIGLPKQLTAWTRTQLHPIEVEDTVQAMLEWEDGCLGSVHISTAESGREERLEIAGTAGVMRIAQGKILVNLFETHLEQFAIENHNMWAAPSSKPFDLDMPAGQGDHVAVYQNLHSAILEGTPLLISAEEARHSLELANAMILSSYQKQALSLPIDRQTYSTLLESLKTGKV
jgi:predicted dehydrogenase